MFEVEKLRATTTVVIESCYKGYGRQLRGGYGLTTTMRSLMVARRQEQTTDLLSAETMYLMPFIFALSTRYHSLNKTI